MTSPAPRSFRKKLIHVEAIQLTWQNWGAICNFVPPQNFVRGTWIDEQGRPLPEDQYRIGKDNDDIGLVLKRTDSERQFLVHGNDWIVKWEDGFLSRMKPDKFHQMFEDDSCLPVHPFEIRIAIGANTWEFAQDAIKEITERFEELGPDYVGIASGGWNGSFSVDVSKRDVTPEQYRDELEQWRQREAEAKQA